MGRTRRITCALLTGAGLLFSVACNRPSFMGVNYPHAHSETLTESADEHYHRVSQIAEQDRRLLQDDLDLLFQSDRPSRLTRWHSK